MFKYFTLLILIFIYSNSLHSQITGVSPKTISLGSSGTAFSRGIDAASINPANLAFYDEGHWMLTPIIPSIFIGFESNFINYDIYSKYFTGKDYGSGKREGYILTDNDKLDILNHFPSNGSGGIGINSEINIFSLYCNYEDLLGGLNFSIKARTIGSIDLPKDALKLLLYGNSINSQYNFDQAQAFSAGIVEFSLGYGFQFYKDKLMKFAAGINLKYLNGIAYAEVDRFNSNFVTTETSLEGKIGLHSTYSYADVFDNKKKNSTIAPAGTGFAVDIGLSAVLNDALSFGVSVTDLGSILWNKNVKEITVPDIGLDTAYKITDVSTEDQYKALEDIFKNRDHDISSKSMVMPMGFHLGGLLALHKLEYFKKDNLFPIFLTSDINFLTYSNLKNKDVFMYTFGLEAWLASWLPVRAGFSLGSMPFAVSFGFGINTGGFDLDIGVGNINGFFIPASLAGVSFGFGTRLKL